jgi:hypothetical protein
VGVSLITYYSSCADHISRAVIFGTDQKKVKIKKHESPYFKIKLPVHHLKILFKIEKLIQKDLSKLDVIESDKNHILL